jgi:hypothetical protein
MRPLATWRWNFPRWLADWQRRLQLEELTKLPFPEALLMKLSH